MIADEHQAEPGGGSGPGRVTAREVAALAGVSLGTVSNALNRPEKVAPATLQRITEAATQLGWSRDQIAQQLRGGRSAAIGAVFVELSPHTVRMLTAVEADLAAEGFTVQITTSADDPQREFERIDLFSQQRVRGVLLSPVHDFYPAQLDRLRKLGIPIMLLGRHPAVTGVCSVTGDDVLGGRLAAEHLLSQGHRRLRVVGGRADNHHVQARLAGVQTAVPPRASLTIQPTDTYDVEAGIDAAATIAALPVGERPTAVIVINDLIAIGLIRGLQLARLRVPTDISVIGYDDLAISQAAAVPLTTIRNPHLAVAHRAASLLLQEIRDTEDGVNHTHQQFLVEPQLVVRESTAAPCPD